MVDKIEEYYPRGPQSTLDLVYLLIQEYQSAIEGTGIEPPSDLPSLDDFEIPTFEVKEAPKEVENVVQPSDLDKLVEYLS